MSKYTTEVRFICESLAGLTESTGFNNVKNVLANAAPQVFDFDFPIFDEQYRLPLEIKILRHYYTREISEETVGLWKLRLEDRMTTIMPYYNQLYESALLNFNPFYDVDLTTTHQGSESGTVNGTSYEEGKTNVSRDNSTGETINESSNKSGNNSATKTGNNENVSEENVNESFIKTGSNDSAKKNTGYDNISHTGTIVDEEEKDRTVNSSGSEETNSNQTTNENRDNRASNEGVSTNSANSESKNHTENSNTQWDLFSDTPQGGIEGLNSPNSHAPSQQLENNIYLSTARKITNNGDSDSDNTQTDSEIGTSSNSSESKESLSGSANNNIESQRSGIEIENNRNDLTREYDEHTDREVNLNEQNNNNYSEINDGNTGKNKTENTMFNESHEDQYGEINVGSSDRQTSETENENATLNNQRSDMRASTTTDEYLQKVVGKSGGRSYASLLLEYRETFLNIDEMIIEELHDLFFGLW